MKATSKNISVDRLNRRFGIEGLELTKIAVLFFTKSALPSRLEAQVSRDVLHPLLRDENSCIIEFCFVSL